AHHHHGEHQGGHEKQPDRHRTRAIPCGKTVHATAVVHWGEDTPDIVARHSPLCPPNGLRTRRKSEQRHVAADPGRAPCNTSTAHWRSSAPWPWAGSRTC